MGLENTLEKPSVEAVEKREGSTWTTPPTEMRIKHLKLTHMKLWPLNMRLVYAFDFKVLCVPRHKYDESKRTTKIKWIAEVVRQVTYKNQHVRNEAAQYYYFDEL